MPRQAANATPAERKWILETLIKIEKHLPVQYSAQVQERLKAQGIERSRRYIIECNNYKRYDVAVVKILVDIARIPAEVEPISEE